MIARYPDWPKRLREFMDSRATQPFSYGANDCCLFACDAVKAITGVDPAREFRGYIGKEEAEAVLGEHGGVDGIAERVTAQLGFQEIPVSFLQRGDLVICLSTEPTLCVIDLNGKPCGPGESGATWYPRGYMRRGWRVG